MTTWNEHSFLERLMPHLQHDNTSKKWTCPDSATLTAFTENQLDGSDRDAIAAHLAQCSKCAELHDRLVSFSKATVAVQDSEWENAEKRIDLWMTGFLDAQMSARQSPTPARSRATGSELRWSWRPSWRFQWAVSAVAVVALLAGAAFLLKPKLPLGNEAKQVAVQTPPPVETQSMPAPAAGKTEIAPEKPTPTEQMGRSESETVAGKTPMVTAEANRAPGNSRVAPHPSAAPQHQETVVARAGTPRAPTPVPTPALHAPSVVPAPPVSTDSRAAASRKAPSVELATQPVMDTKPFERPSVDGTGGATTPPASGQPPSPPAGTATSGSAAVFYRIEADTRLWIKVNSVSRQPDGSFTFRGALLEPVKQAGTVLLDQGSGIIGSGRVSQGKTSLLIGEVIVGGTHYRLKGAVHAPLAPGARGGSQGMHASPTLGAWAGGSASTGKAASGTRNTQPPGTGPAVEFDAGKVLETWLASTSTYEKVPEARGPLPAAQQAPK